jgi:hypothetical protein
MIGTIIPIRTGKAESITPAQPQPICLALPAIIKACRAAGYNLDNSFNIYRCLSFMGHLETVFLTANYFLLTAFLGDLYAPNDADRTRGKFTAR